VPLLAPPAEVHGVLPVGDCAHEQAVLKQNLFRIGEALDKFYADSGKYPDSLDDLVTKRYLRSPPVDPVTESTTTWIVVPPTGSGKGAVYDVKSGAPGNPRDGTAYGDW